MKVHNFQGYLKSKVSNSLLEKEDCSYGANPEEEEMKNDSDMGMEDEFDLGGDLEGGESEEEEAEEVTLEDLKAMLDDISSRVSALEGGEEGIEDEEVEGDDEIVDAEDEEAEDEEA